MPDETPPVRMVPHARFKEVTDGLASAKTEIATLNARVKELEPLIAERDDWKGKHDTVHGEFKTAQATWAEERALLSNGVTDEEDVDLVRHYYGKLDGAAKPKTIGDFMAGMKAEGAPIPKGLQHIFGAKPAAGAGTGQPPPVPKPGGSGGPPHNGAKPGAAALTQATIDFQSGKITAAALQATIDASRSPG